jgi:subtilisin family serine protease
MVNQTHHFPNPPSPQPTGRYLVLFQPDADLSSIRSVVENSTGAKTIDSRDIGTTSTATEDALSHDNAIIINRFKVAAIAPQGDVGVRMGALKDAEGVRLLRPEFYMFAINELQRRYANWVREGLQLLAEGVTSGLGAAGTGVGEAGFLGAPFADTDEFTWGLAAVGAHRSAYTGRGIRVAVLDTGLDLSHPDFVDQQNRQIVTQSFVENESVQDGQGHGTHTAGTVGGPNPSKIGRRYGVAPEVDLYIGKVLNNQGSGKELDILNGMNWAIDQKCVAISMSLGRSTFPGEKPDPLYEEVGTAALREDSLIIAAAGNESARDSGFIAPVGAPANSPSIMAVAAVKPNLKVASFSCGGLSARGGEVNISGPGVAVYSSFPLPQQSKVLQGTSMACPHVAGVAALWAQSDQSLRGQKLWDALERSALEIGSFRDYGRGLVQVPDIGVGV